MPPLAVVGFGLSTRDWPIFLGASWLFMTNLLAIALTIAIVARCYGFGSQNSPRQSLWQLGVLASTFLLLSIPLGIRSGTWRATASAALPCRPPCSTRWARARESIQIGRAHV